MESLVRCAELSKHMTTLAETSVGGTGGLPMTSSDERAVNIDEVMKSYVAALPDQDGRPPSVDSLIRYDTDSPVLVEFKSGDSIPKDNIKLKLTSSLMMLSDLAGVTVDDCRNHVSFLLVYDRERFFAAGNGSNDPSRSVQGSDSRAMIRMTIDSLANSRRLPRQLRGLDNGMKGVFVKDFKVLDKNELQAYLSAKAS